MREHLVSKETIQKCYCGRDLPEDTWKSEFNSQQHYKCNHCLECGKKNCVTVEFDGSGHDSWKNKREETFDELVAKEHKKSGKK